MTSAPTAEGPLLWHYTSTAGALGIVQQGEVWASQIQFQNDGKELQIGFDVAAYLLAAEFKASLPSLGPVIEAMRQYYADTPATAYIFIACFSEQEDQLSQWRAVQTGGAYSLGVDRDALLSDATSRGWRLEPCVYDPLEHQRLVREALEAFFTAYQRGDFDALDPDPASRGIRFSVPEVLRVAPFLKHAAFREEQEWRLVSPISDQGMMFRAGTHSIIPYVGFQLPRVDGKLWIPRAIVGPIQHAALAARGLVELFIASDVAGWSVGTSSAPFRQWT